MVDGELTVAGLWLESFQFRLPPLLLVFEGNQNAGLLYCFRLALQGHHILYNLVNYSYYSYYYRHSLLLRFFISTIHVRHVFSRS